MRAFFFSTYQYHCPGDLWWLDHEFSKRVLRDLCSPYLLDYTPILLLPHDLCFQYRLSKKMIGEQLNQYIKTIEFSIDMNPCRTLVDVCSLQKGFNFISRVIYSLESGIANTCQLIKLYNIHFTW